MTFEVKGKNIRAIIMKYKWKLSNFILYEADYPNPDLDKMKWCKKQINCCNFLLDQLEKGE